MEIASFSLNVPNVSFPVSLARSSALLFHFRLLIAGFLFPAYFDFIFPRLIRCIYHGATHLCHKMPEDRAGMAKEIGKKQPQVSFSISFSFLQIECGFSG